MFELLNCSMQTKATTARKNHVCYIKLPTPSHTTAASLSLTLYHLRSLLCVYVCTKHSVYLHLAIDECKILNSCSSFFVVSENPEFIETIFFFPKPVPLFIAIINWQNDYHDAKNVCACVCIGKTHIFCRPGNNLTILNICLCSSKKEQHE